MLGQWTPNAAEAKRIAKQTRTAKRQRELKSTGEKQYIGRPAGPKAKGAKVPKTSTLPIMRFSVVPK